MDFVKHGLDQGFEEFRCRNPACLLGDLNEGELRCALDRNGKVELALSCAHFGNVDMEVANGICPSSWVFLSSFTFGKRLMRWRCRQRCSDERVRCGIVSCRA